jgi:hypothetical protein
MHTGTGLFAIALVACTVLLLLLTSHGPLPLLLIPLWVVAVVLWILWRRNRLYGKPCPRCGATLVRKFEGGVSRPHRCEECLAVIAWDEDLNPYDTGLTFIEKSDEEPYS